MKHYLRLGDWLGPGVRLPFADAYVETGDDGWVSREIGLDRQDRVVYKFPLTGSPSGFRGMCDMVTFATTDASDDMSEGAFEVLWNAPLGAADQDQSIRAIQGPSLGQRAVKLLARKGPPRS